MSKLKLSSFNVPRKRIVDGDWIVYRLAAAPDGSTPARFLVSGPSKEAYKIAMDELSRDLAKKYGKERIPDDVAYARQAQLIAEHLLHGWDGLDQVYSPELAEQLLSDRDNEALGDAVMWCAREVERVNFQFEEDLEKNSAAPSVTS